MLDELRHEVAVWLAGVTSCAFASAGPGGVQASWVACLADGLRLYLLLPAVADHLLNVENGEGVALAGEGWRMTGTARVLGDSVGPWTYARLPWQTVVEVVPVALYFDEVRAGAHGVPMRKSVDFAPLHP